METWHLWVQWVTKHSPSEKEEGLQRSPQKKYKYNLKQHKFWGCMKLRDDDKQEIRANLSMKVNGVIHILINSYKGPKIRIISALD